MEPMMITAVIMVIAIAMFVWEKLPLALTAMMVAMSLQLTGVLTAAQAFSGFVNSSVILFASMFVVSGAFEATGVAQKTGDLVMKFSKTENSTLIVTMVVTAFVSAWMSNTGTAAIMLPIVIGICKSTGYARSRLLMPMAFAATMGGSLTLIASPGNLIAHGLLQQHGYAGYAFFDYGKAGVPLVIVGILFFIFIGKRLLPDNKDLVETEVKQKDFSHIPQWKKTVALGTLIVVVIMMIFVDQVGIPLHVTSTLGAIFLVLTRVMTEKEAYNSISWPVIFLFAGTLPLATALEITGAGAAFAQWTIGMLGGDPSPMAVTGVIFMTAVVMTSLMSNTATTALLAPISISIAHQMGADPMAAAAATVVGAAMSFATPIATPPNTMVVAHGGYKFMDYVKAGVPLSIVMSIAGIIILPIVFPFWP
jgi:anion transporter